MFTPPAHYAFLQQRTCRYFHYIDFCTEHSKSWKLIAENIITQLYFSIFFNPSHYVQFVFCRGKRAAPSWRSPVTMRNCSAKTIKRHCWERHQRTLKSTLCKICLDVSTFPRNCISSAVLWTSRVRQRLICFHLSHLSSVDSTWPTFHAIPDATLAL